MRSITFQFKRFWWLIENHYRLELKSLWGHLFIFWLLSLFLQLLFFREEGGGWFLFNFFLVLGGVIQTTGVFKNHHLEKNSVNPFLLPASPLEKVLSPWFISFLNYFVLFLLGYCLANLLAASPVGHWVVEQIGIYGAPVAIFNPFDIEIFHSLKYYWFFHSWYFFGAIYFSKNPFIRSTLYLICMYLLTGFVFLSFFVLFITKNFGLGLANLPYDELPNVKLFFEILYWGLIPLFFYGLSFVRLRETEDRR